MMFEVVPVVVTVMLRNTSFDGAEATAAVPPLSEFMQMSTKNSDLVDAFLSHLTRWNLAVGGQAVPPTHEGADTLPPNLVLSLAVGWFEAMTTPERDRPLETDELARKVAAAIQSNGSEAPPTGVDIL